MCRPGLRVLIATSQKKVKAANEPCAVGALPNLIFLSTYKWMAEEARSGLIRGSRTGWYNIVRNNRITTQMINDEMDDIGRIGKNRKRRLRIADSAKYKPRHPSR